MVLQPLFHISTTENFTSGYRTESDAFQSCLNTFLYKSSKDTVKQTLSKTNRGWESFPEENPWHVSQMAARVWNHRWAGVPRTEPHLSPSLLDPVWFPWPSPWSQYNYPYFITLKSKAQGKYVLLMVTQPGFEPTWLHTPLPAQKKVIRGEASPLTLC